MLILGRQLTILIDTAVNAKEPLSNAQICDDKSKSENIFARTEARLACVEEMFRETHSRGGGA